MVKNLPAMKEPGFDPWVGKMPWRRERIPTLVFWLENSMDSGVSRVGKNWTRLSDFLKWTGMGEFNSDDHYIYNCGQESLRRNGVAIMVNKRVQNAVLGCKCSFTANLFFNYVL